MPLQLLSRTTTDIVRSRSPSPLSTPASKPPIPTICLTTATPCDSNLTSDASRVAPWTTSEVSPIPIAPKPIPNGEKSRKRLVPKKSKLSLLGISSSAAMAREQDFSDVVRRVGGASAKNGDNGFEIYVDPANDPDIGEILMVKKKKSRLTLDGLQWGTLGEVTNVPSASKPKEKKEKGRRDSVLKTKVDENQKWWSIGRGRRDSKERDKEKDKDCAKSPEPSDRLSDTRTRFNSLDSSVLLKGSANTRNSDSPVEHSGAPTPAATASTGSGNGKGSVALRAMRSVRSLARIGSWAQLKNTPNPDTVAIAPVTKDKELDGKKKKKRKDKEKGKEKERIKETNRYSGSSFEAGALTASPSGSKSESKTLGKKKASILGIGLPSTMRLRPSRCGSAESCTKAGDDGNNGSHRLSVDSVTLLGGGILARGRSGSAMSTVSSLRPMSTKSSGSRESSGSSVAASVKWDEAGLETVKEIRRKDKEARRKEKEESKKSKRSKAKDSTHKSSDSQKRTPLAAIFPGIASGLDVTEQPPVIAAFDTQGAIVDSQSSAETPRERSRCRPLSDQPLGRSQSRPIYEGDDDNAAMSLLDAATDDLARLINRLDLEATPGSVEMTPTTQRSLFLCETSPNLALNNRSAAESPVKGLCHKNPSIVSLRPYAQSCSKSAELKIGRNIAPWSTLNASILPSKPSPDTIRVNFQDNTATVRSYKRTMTPAPAADPSPVFKALRPATSRLPVLKTVASSSPGVSSFVGNAIGNRSPSAMTFGSSHSKSVSLTSFSTSPVFKKAQSLLRKKSSSATQAALDSDNLPILPEARRSLGLAGTMGSSVGSIAKQVYSGSDADCDIPDELQAILSNSDQEGDDTILFRPRSAAPSPGMPPELPLPVVDGSVRNSLADVPVFRATVIDEDNHHADHEEGGSEEDTKRSFDFTGELRKLRESGVSDRRSFIEQLENAFRTPAKIDLRYDFEDLPPIPKLPTLEDELSRAGECSFSLPADYGSCSDSPRSSLATDDNAEPSLLSRSHSFATAVSEEQLLNVVAPRVPSIIPSASACPSNGELNRDFKFGGKPSAKGASPLTLSDIIPPPDIARFLAMGSFAGDESSPMKSIFANAIEVKSKTQDAARRSLTVPTHHRNSSVLSFTGLDSFAEVRRGFEYSDNRPGFYPPPAAPVPPNRRHRKQESIYSIASVSSYGNVLHGGSADPFDYASVVPLPSLRERPSSDDFSLTVSTTIDDTFCSIRRRQPRRRVDSDTSSFYFRASLHPYSRGQRRPESGISIGPPISLFNRNSTYHRRGDSDASLSSIANCRPLSWTRPRSTISVDSVLSDFSEANIGRPGLGDKMLDSALECGTALTSISASPPPSLVGSLRGERMHLEYDKRSSYDSIMDSQFESQKTDSLFEKTNHRNSISSTDSSFFEQPSGEAAAKLPRYRPISSLSIASVHSPPKEDDTMISMLGGGHVRRRSVTSMIGSSPCLQVERRKNVLTNPPETVFDRIKNMHPGDHEPPEIPRIIETKPSVVSATDSSKFDDECMVHTKLCLPERETVFDRVKSMRLIDHEPPEIPRATEAKPSIVPTTESSKFDGEHDPLECETVFNRIKNMRSVDHESPEIPRVIETKPSIASSTGSQFGDSRMIRAKHGLLERQSLENTALVGDGEDISESFRMPVFTRPSRANRSRSSTCTSSSGAETPPLSISDGYSSFSEGSLSSIDLSQLNTLLTSRRPSNATFDRGHRGHRRRISQARASRTSVYETIEEELLSSMGSSELTVPSFISNTPKPDDAASKTAMSPPRVYVVDSATSSVESFSLWDDERGVTALRKYYALRDEAEDAVTDSKRTWLDTPFSLFATQSFEPPRHPSGMQAMLEHSVQNYKPLPSDLRPYRARSRVNSRPSPYPRTLKTSLTSSSSTERLRATVANAASTDSLILRHPSPLSNALQQLVVDSNIPSTHASASKECVALDKPDRVFGFLRGPRVGPTTRRGASGLPRRSTGRNGAENKENNVTISNISVRAPVTVNISQGSMITPSDGLRLNRPRPTGRPTLASRRSVRA